MRISVNYDNGQIFQHFGRTEMFKLYDVEDGKVVKVQMLPGAAEGHGALESAGIEVCANVTGDADEAVQAYLAGTLQYSKDAHNCGGHHH